MFSANDYFQLYGGCVQDGCVSLDSPVYKTQEGTAYLKHPGVVLLAQPHVSLLGMDRFLFGYQQGFEEYTRDEGLLSPGAQLCKIAGQLCYMSFGKKRTYNAQAGTYFANVKAAGHGSILEHANFSVLLYGVSRSTTHELVRHRAGMAISQQSQRYVSGKLLRFVERPEYQNEDMLHQKFLARIDRSRKEYEEITGVILSQQKSGKALLQGEQKTDLRKKVQQTARSVLPNETEAPLVLTGNVRAWRHILSMRASAHAETEIREVAVRLFLCLTQVESFLFDDFLLEPLSDGTMALKTPFPKV